MIFDAQHSLVQSTQLECSEVDVPLTVVDLFETDVFADKRAAHVDRN